MNDLSKTLPLLLNNSNAFYKAQVFVNNFEDLNRSHVVTQFDPASMWILPMRDGIARTFAKVEPRSGSRSREWWSPHKFCYRAQSGFKEV